MYSKETLNSFVGDTFLNTTGLKNLQHEGKKKLPPDDGTEDEIEDGDIGDENGTEEPSNEIDDEANDDKANDETSDNVTDTVDAVPGEVKTAPEPTKEGTTMKYDLTFFETAGKELYDALVNKLGMSTELHQAILDLAAMYPEIRKDVVALSKDLDYQPPAYGWQYQAKDECWTFSSKVYDNKKAAEIAARDIIAATGKTFEELFIKIPFYKGDDGKFTNPVPKGSRDYEIIVKQQAEANAEA